MEKAIALLEVQAMVTAIVGLDAMVKAADVKLIHVEKRLGGRLPWWWKVPSLPCKRLPRRGKPLPHRLAPSSCVR